MSGTPITPIRFSEINLDRLNRAFVLLELQLKGLKSQIDALNTAAAKATAGKPGYPGIENGSVAMIQGPVPGGPSPIPPWVRDHALIVMEGSKPIHDYLLDDGQVMIGCTGDDPRPANIQGATATVFPITARGIAISNGCNEITISLAKDLIDWVETVASILAIFVPW